MNKPDKRLSLMLTVGDNSSFFSNSPTQIALPDTPPLLGSVPSPELRKLQEELRECDTRLQDFETRRKDPHDWLPSCPACDTPFATSHFPLWTGICRHTICNLCHQGNKICPVRGCHKEAAFRTAHRNKELENCIRMATAASYDCLQQAEEARENWSRHVAVLRKHIPTDSGLQDQNNALRDMLLKAQENARHSKSSLQARTEEMGDEVLRWEEDYSRATDTIAYMAKAIHKLTRGNDMYYFLCPHCESHMETERVDNVKSSMPLLSQEYWCGNIVDWKAQLSLEQRDALRETKAYLSMRRHLKKCIPIQMGATCKEEEMPMFYRLGSAGSQLRCGLRKAASKRVMIEATAKQHVGKKNK